MTKMVPYSHQSLDNEDIDRVLKVLKSDWLTQGPEIAKFEAALCEYTGAGYAVAVSSGTAALHIACIAAGIGPGDEAITSPMTFVASANCIAFCGARPVFADVEADTVNISPEKMREKITGKTKAVIPVHFAGHPCDMDEIRAIANKRGITIIEDAAHALGAEHNNVKVGACRRSDMAVFSFHPVKSITTGEGGAILTNRKDLFKRLTAARSHGIVKEGFNNKAHGDWYYEMQFLGYNYRMTDIQAALGTSQLRKLDKFIAKRRKIAKRYDEAFDGNPYFRVPHERGGYYSAYHLYPIRLNGKYAGKRSKIFSELRKKGVGAQVHYIPAHLQPYYADMGYRRGDYPVSEGYYDSAISIPLYPGMSDADARFVIDTLLRTIKRCA